MSDKENMCVMKSVPMCGASKSSYVKMCRFFDSENGDECSLRDCSGMCCCGDAIADAKAKRKPMPDGTLPLTGSEKEEFEKIVGFPFTEIYYDGALHIKHKDSGWGMLVTVKKILYLAKLFDMERNDHVDKN